MWTQHGHVVNRGWLPILNAGAGNAGVQSGAQLSPTVASSGTMYPGDCTAVPSFGFPGEMSFVNSEVGGSPASPLTSNATSPDSLFALCNSGLQNRTTRLSPSGKIRRSFTSSSRPSKTTLCGRGTNLNAIVEVSSTTTLGASHGIHNSASNVNKAPRRKRSHSIRRGFHTVSQKVQQAMYSAAQ